MYIYIYIFSFFFVYYRSKMVRSYKRKTKKYTDLDIKNALKKLGEGYSYRKVSEIFGIPKSSLQIYQSKSKKKCQNKEIYIS